MAGTGPGRGGGPGLARMYDPASYLAGLKTQLGITPEQEAPWADYARIVEGHAKQMQDLHASLWQSMPTATWQERRDMMNRMFQSRNEAHATVQAAAEKLLPSLTPAQRSRASTMLPGLIVPGSGMGMGRRMGRGPGGGWGPGRTP